ncbi:hypothetical protein Osc7112_5319 [Oscillatoria nigro-viridis PCC 7112]|uniref:Uncharacterized protein n=1 Tax=Phormidium nigroviride PCC 7112 TaxID=179408 RepID=K9VPZ9_9CYAN|nr:hypothetical protein Osc7112_5319 [Oscillatoria nigro-viridis PCC 7112]
MPVPQFFFVIVEQQARCLCHKIFFVIVEQQARCLCHKIFFVIVERAGEPVKYFLENSKLKNYKFMKNCIKIRSRIYNSTLNYTCLKKPIANG